MNSRVSGRCLYTILYCCCLFVLKPLTSQSTMKPWRYSPQWNLDVTIPNETLTSQSPMNPWRHSPQWTLDVTVPNEPLTSQSPMTPCILLTGIFVVWYMYRIVNTGLISTEALTDILALYVGLMYNHVLSDKSFTYTGYRVIQVDRTAAVPTGCVTIELHVYNTYTLFSFFFLYFRRNPRVTREL